ncbi:hypothetical protein NE237_011912 [Protea cynaroides]|uniref:Uncharacterized protein n=1 Tax=Protea cynaroides TaxID=273540 RepID=A0A9Q0JWA8_9MAGN|nr:hypothetical protein NE237_011912 [Protea cynaroides]
MGSALDTFGGQSYGAKQHHMPNIRIQRAVLVILLVSISLAFIWTNMGHILQVVGQDPGIIALLHIFVCWILVFKSGLGYIGAALANSSSYWINVILLAFYVLFSPACKKTWTGFSKEALHGVLNFIKLAISSTVMICLGMWSFEMIVRSPIWSSSKSKTGNISSIKQPQHSRFCLDDPF